MEFLNPWLWPAAIMAIAPLVVHLLSRVRMPTIELATFRFLSDGFAHPQRRTRLLEALLAILRVAAVVLMAFVFARPVLHGARSLWTAGGPERDVVLIVDASASMNATSDGASSFDRARSTARAVIERLAEADRVTLIRAGSAADCIVHRAARDAVDLTTKIDQLQTGPTRGNLFAALEAAEARLSAESRAVVYLLTDMQASGWKEVQELSGHGVLKDQRLIVVDCGSAEHQANRAVIGRAARRARAVVGLPLVLRPEVWNPSRDRSTDVRLSATIDDQEVAAFQLTLQPGEKATRDVLYVPRRAGIVRGKFEIDRDQLADDDLFEFTINVAPPVPVLVVRGRSADPMPRDETLFLKTALESTTDAGSADDRNNATPDAAQASFVVREVVEGGFTARMIGDAEVVVLVNCGNLMPIHMEWLRDFVMQGGGLIVLPGDRVQAESYNTAFFPTPGVPDERLIDATLSSPTAAPTAEPLAFGKLHDTHPLLLTFRSPSVPFFNSARVTKRFGLHANPASKTLQTLIEFSDGSPALIEGQFGDGRIMLSAFPFDATWSNLPTQPEFAPLVMRMVQYVQRWSHVETSDGPTPEATVEIAAPRRWGRVTGEVRQPDGETSWLAFAPQGSRWIAPFSRTLDRGVYVARVHGGTTEQPLEGEAAFAINTGLEESDFHRATPGDVQAWLSETPVDVVSLSAAADASCEVFGTERDLTGLAVCLLAGVIVAEFLLATMRKTKARASGLRANGR